jgi:hypothetical protein
LINQPGSRQGDVPAAEIIRRDFKEYVLPQPSANAHRQSQPIDPSAMVNQSKEAT